MPSSQKRIAQVTLGTGLSLAILGALDSKFNVKYDLKYIYKMLPMMSVMPNTPDDYTLADDWETTHDDVTKTIRNKPAIIFSEDGRVYSFEAVERASNRVANFFLKNFARFGLESKATVAVMVENRPEFIFIVLGLTKAGLIPALINTNNKRKPLSHSIKVSNCKAMIFGDELLQNVSTIAEELEQSSLPLIVCSDSSVKQFEMSEESKKVMQLSVSLDEEMKISSDERPSREVRKDSGKLSEYACIYTSGTTGLPKACIIKHSKMIQSPRMWKHFYGVSRDDVVYCPLPLYHGAAGIIGFSSMTALGCTFVIARRFSASKFFKECYEYNCTVTQYVGETARYLLHSPRTEYDAKNKVWLAVGNGLRKEIWLPFMDRFGIQKVGEFYGSTEGNVAIAQLYDRNQDEEGVGAVGRAGWILKKGLKFKIVKHDVESELPLRDKNGFCIECAVNEPGELLGLVDPNDDRLAFAGYTSKEATEKKLLRDVLKKGDVYFRTGDIIRSDRKGWIYFVDRIGDTFRWKGENVSTNEVSEIVSVFPKVLEANVYGVKVPGTDDGRACMAAIVLQDLEEGSEEDLQAALADFDFKAFNQEMDKNLAKYAKPMFVRFLRNMQQTGTFKQQKVGLVKDGVEISKIKDPVFIFNQEQKTYIPFDNSQYTRLANGDAKL